MLHRVAFGRLSRVQRPERRDVAPVVDAREQRYGGFNPARRRRDDSRGRAVDILDSKAELLEHQHADGVCGQHAWKPDPRRRPCHDFAVTSE